MTVLTATAATTLSLRVCVLLVSILITRRRRRVPSTMSTSPSSSTRASLVSSVKTHLTNPPSQDRLDGPVCWRSGLSQKKTHTICARSLLGESEDDAGGAVPRPITRPADHRRQGHARGSGRVQCFWVCFFLGLDEHAADDEQAKTTGKTFHEQARPSEESDAKDVHKHRDREKIEPMTSMRLPPFFLKFFSKLPITNTTWNFQQLPSTTRERII